MSEEPKLLQQARRKMRDVQSTFGHVITPERSVTIGRVWNEKIEQDPTGELALKFAIYLYNELLYAEVKQ